MSFFTNPASERKRKRPSDTVKSRSSAAPRPRPDSSTRKAQPRRQRRSESISSASSEDNASVSAYSSSGSSSGHEDETGAERRLRLAERYLENVKAEVQTKEGLHGFDAEDLDRDLIAERLKQDAAESKGRLYRFIARDYDYAHAMCASFRGESDSATAIAACLPFVYTASKDRRLSKWRLADPPIQPKTPTKNSKSINSTSTSTSASKSKPKGPSGPPPRRRPTLLVSRKGDRKANPKHYQHHVSSILSVAASSDGKFVVSGGADKKLIVWNAADLTPLKVFMQHRDTINSLALQRGANRLYSASSDRTIKTWALDELAYVETLFGHQDEVVDVAALSQERCLSAGARDRTVRLWKVVEETQLVFRGGGGVRPKESATGKDGVAGKDGATGKSNIPNKDRQRKAAPLYTEGSIERVALIDDDTFVTGSDSGSLRLWNVQKKKHVFELPLAHGLDPPPTLEESFADKDLTEKKTVAPPRPRWVTALKAVPFSDLVVSGSWDGCVRVWRVTEDKKRIEEVAVVRAGELEGGEGEGVRGQSKMEVDGGVANGGETNGKGGGSEMEVDGEGQRVMERNGGEADPTNGKADQTNGDGAVNGNGAFLPTQRSRVARGIVNDIEIIERGDRGREGLCIVAAIGKEHRMGRWKMNSESGARNGAIVLEIALKREERDGKTVRDVAV